MAKEPKLVLLASAIGAERFKWNESMKHHTFSKSPGAAECFYIATNQRELISVLEAAEDLGINYTLVGSGTKTMYNSALKGLVIKNRTSFIKVAGMKGKFTKGSLGIEETFIEADSGVSLNKLNEYVKGEHLREIEGFSSLNSTVGGAIFLDPLLREAVQSLRVWEAGGVRDIKLDALRRNMVILSVIFKFKASDIIKADD